MWSPKFSPLANVILPLRLERGEGRGEVSIRGARSSGYSTFSSTARVFASVFSMGVPVKPMIDALGKASLRLLREAVGHLAGLFIHLAAETILAAVRFIRDDGNVVPSAQLGHRSQRNVMNS